jgi:hypothetical protein
MISPKSLANTNKISKLAKKGSSRLVTLNGINKFGQKDIVQIY